MYVARLGLDCWAPTCMQVTCNYIPGSPKHNIVKHVVTEKKPKEESGKPKESIISAEDQHIQTPHREWSCPLRS